MNESVSDCDRWHEPISLLAAGCLPADEEAGVRRHLADCAACSARLADLTALCARLARSAAPARVVAVCDRWQASEAATTGPGTRPSLAGFFAKLLAGVAAVAAALLVCVAWLADREPGGRPAPSARSVADGGSRPAAEAARGRSGAVAPPASIPRDAHAVTPPTLLQFELALAQSDEAFDALLLLPAASKAIQPLDARSLLEEHL
jgi:anti-sigma factor RsiW